MQPDRFGHARRLRRAMTDAERVVWRHVRGPGIAGCRFRRQEPLGLYYPDFISFQARLIVEADGGQHAESEEADAERTRWFAARGYRVARFWNVEILNDWDMVERELWRLVTDPAAKPFRGSA